MPNGRNNQIRVRKAHRSGIAATREELVELVERLTGEVERLIRESHNNQHQQSSMTKRLIELKDFADDKLKGRMTTEES